MDKNSKIHLRTNNKIPVIGIGTWELTRETADIISYALNLGYPMIDTSSDYGTQPGIAEGIKESGCKREDFYLVTKVEETDNSYERVKSNLKELKLEYADLILIHRPPKNGVGEDLWGGLIRAQKEGLVKDIGVSNYSIEQIDQLEKLTGLMPSVNQIEWSPFGHDLQVLNKAKDKGIIVMAYSPPTRGERLGDKRLIKIANKYSKSPAQVLIKWSIQIGTVPITKANKPEHVKENIDVFDFFIEKDDMNTLSGLNEKFSALGVLSYV